MNLWIIRASAMALGSILLSAPMMAQEVIDLPPVKTLNCSKDCQNATNPKRVIDPNAQYHVKVTQVTREADLYLEGVVVLQGTVTKEGILKEQKVIGLIGVQRFADDALEASKSWRYQPAMQGGVPVDRANWAVKIIFSMPGVTGATPHVYRVIGDANALSEQGKHGEAITTLLPILSMPKLNFYEREAVCLQLAIEYSHQGDLLTAREYLDDINLIGDRYLAENLHPTLRRITVLANAKTGQFLEAKEAFDQLRQSLAADDPLIKLMQTTDAQLHESKVLTVIGRITKTNLLQSWDHKLMWHDFAIPRVNGKLDRIAIWCGEHLLESPYSDKAEWHIPKDWDGCKVTIYGDPGTKFLLAETEDAPIDAAKAAAPSH